MSKFKKEITNNSNICNCGQHQGIGEAMPQERAQMYNWFRERRPKEYTAEQRQYLESYERAHGQLASDSFLFNNSRFKDYDKVKAAWSGVLKAQGEGRRQSKRL